ncbi:DsrE family protein [Magnetospirillum sulfuroxidans]|uniref:DsrE family protein n=1 Tax=Magnetospirillum sulfuroxidans TaxID=611300 RepID=A0ABS5IA94_9PROT|nr:DsrE family protein [Magnetospirillum sulfuroxidans]MBR9971325.1 DsrE family protein [Magnetospirillum sulfuroxidans]
MRAVLAFLLTLMLAVPAGAADTIVADPKPSWDNPRKVVLQLTNDDVRHVNNVLYNAINIQKFYGQDNVKVAVIAFGPGVRALLKADSTVGARIASLKDYEVEFVACGNTLEVLGKNAGDLLPGIAVVPFGIPEIMERQLTGWQVIAP